LKKVALIISSQSEISVAKSTIIVAYEIRWYSWKLYNVYRLTENAGFQTLCFCK